MRQRQLGSEFHTTSSLRHRLLRHNIAIGLFLLFASAAMIIVYWYYAPGQDGLVAESAADTLDVEVLEIEQPGASLYASINKPVKRPPVVQRVEQSPPPILIGIIAGHRGSDSGTVCEDGLTEAQITTGLAERLSARLHAEGVASETLDEFDSRLDGYSATALLSIHVDSCDYINDLATGFKLSGSPYTDSSQLSICIEQAYREATQLPYHPSSITPHMADYHAFREIDPATPAAIIEVGFLNLDREILTLGSGRVVRGLAEGLLCFLERAP
jgi:N-acetylmuramoyl-L-alanine amidase